MIFGVYAYRLTHMFWVSENKCLSDIRKKL